MVKHSGTIGCVLMELNLVYDAARRLSRPILFAPIAHRSLSNINALNQQHNAYLVMKIILLFCMFLHCNYHNCSNSTQIKNWCNKFIIFSLFKCEIIFQGLDVRGKMIDNILIANTCIQPDIFKRTIIKMAVGCSFCIAWIVTRPLLYIWQLT